MSEQIDMPLISPDTREILCRLVNVMNRCDPFYCQAHMQQLCSDAEWDDVLQAAEDEIERLGLPPHPPIGSPR